MEIPNGETPCVRPVEIPDKEVLRYLGYRGADADEKVAALIEEMRTEFTENIIPKSVYGIWDCRVNSAAVTLNCLTINSEKLAKHLHKCRRLALMAATLGPEADTIIRRYSLKAMEKALIAQALGAVMIDAYCDKIAREIAQTNELGAFEPTIRFSPGYGDFDIAHQKNIIKLLNCDKRIGLALTDGYMLVPTKSITAIIGYKEFE